MTIYRFKKSSLILQFIVVLTVFTLLFSLLLQYSEGNIDLRNRLTVVYSIILLFFLFGFLVSISNKLEIDGKVMRLNSIIGVNEIHLKNITEIKFQFIRKKIIFRQGVNKKIVIISDYRDFKKLYLQIALYLKEAGKGDIIPSKLNDYLNSL